MKKILEYRVFDLLKEPENEKFLDKVKKENPDEYTRFLNLVGNKGLEVAKQKYQVYDPEYKKQQLEIEKAEKLRRKQLGNAKLKELYHEEMLKKYTPQIDEIRSILSSTSLLNMVNYIKKDERINEYLQSCGARRSYKEDFEQTLKEPDKFSYRLNGTVKVDSLRYSKSYMDYNAGGTTAKNIINITHYFNLTTKEHSYTVVFGLFDGDDTYGVKIDGKKIDLFLRKRNEFVKDKLSKSDIDIKELYDLINRFSAALDERVYDKWYEEWHLLQNITKFNL